MTFTKNYLHPPAKHQAASEKNQEAKNTLINRAFLVACIFYVIASASARL